MSTRACGHTATSTRTAAWDQSGKRRTGIGANTPGPPRAEVTAYTGRRAGPADRWGSTDGFRPLLDWNQAVASLPASAAATTSGSRWATSPPYVATCLTSDDETNEYSGLVGRNSVFTPVRPWFI